MTAACRTDLARKNRLTHAFIFDLDESRLGKREALLHCRAASETETKRNLRPLGARAPRLARLPTLYTTHPHSERTYVPGAARVNLCEEKIMKAVHRATLYRMWLYDVAIREARCPFIASRCRAATHAKPTRASHACLALSVAMSLSHDVRRAIS